MKRIALFVCTLILLTIGVISTCLGQDQSQTRGAADVEKLRAELLARDYSDILDARGYISLFDAKNASGEMEYLKHLVNMFEHRKGCNINDRPLTDREYGAFIGWNYLPGEAAFSLHNIQYVLEYCRTHGSLPNTALDLYPELLTVEGYTEFINLGAREQVRRSRYIINPITGRFYDSFINPQWVYGGIDISYVNGIDAIEKHYSSYANSVVDINPDTGEQILCNQLAIVTFYGETPGSILWKWVLPQAVDSQS